MQNFDIIGQLRSFCQSKNIFFSAGDRYYQNADLLEQALQPDQLIMLADFRSRPTFSKGGSVVQSIVYDGVILLGRKFESEVLDDEETEENEAQPATEANLDETFLQKYDRRLMDLMQLLAGLMGEFVCANTLEISAMSMNHDINKFDENIDFVAATITILQ